MERTIKKASHTTLEKLQGSLGGSLDGFNKKGILENGKFRKVCQQGKDLEKARENELGGGLGTKELPQMSQRSQISIFLLNIAEYEGMEMVRQTGRAQSPLLVCPNDRNWRISLKSQKLANHLTSLVPHAANAGGRWDKGCTRDDICSRRRAFVL